MFKKLSQFATVMVAITFLAAIFMSTVAAQKTVDSSVMMERDRMSRVMNPGGNIEDFRREYYNYLSEFESTLRLLNEVPAIREKFNRSGLRPIEKLVEAKRQITEASMEDLILMRTVYAKTPHWREAPKSLESLIGAGLRQQLQASLNSKGNGGVGLDGVADDCAFALQQDHTNTDISIARGVSLGLAALMEGFPTDGLTIAARIAPIAAWAAAEGSVIGIETLKATKDDCNGDAFEAAIQQQVTDSTTTITTAISNAQTAIINNDNSNKDTIVSNDNSNKTAIINNDNANKDTIITAVNNAKSEIIVNANANKDELLRLHIHADLASVDNATPLAIFMLPAVKGGYLELVRTIVVQMITDLAGSSTAQANSFLAKGDAFKDAGNYKSAYDSYRKAYKAAAK